MDYTKKTERKKFGRYEPCPKDPTMFRAIKRGAKWMINKLLRKDLEAEERNDRPS